MSSSRGSRGLGAISWQGGLGSIPGKCSLPGESLGVLIEGPRAFLRARSIAERSQDGLRDVVGMIRLAQ